MVANLGVYFSINLLSVIATTYILTWYILTPSPNQCQMTFMMEPPKFLPIQVDEEDHSSDQNGELTYPTAAIDTGGAGNPKATHAPAEYKLYMYSEFGFPMASNVRHDLKDSMPVLFVPGNAGSYQQVRSLASTCIRKQLQSLDAFKFIFYTIDFGGQLSGISGDLIERQTLFVQKSLRQITRMHPSDTEGTILVGHSVGGFISKFLFTRANFQPNSVPLMISLASPLTRPYLVFDDKMGEIYRKTEQYWNKSKTEQRDTIAISISGGGSDRLVPMHLSLDPAFDLSLTTECMRDVFLSTDHVCVTWCRELMHKLAKLLSALMDKKQTRLIPDKSSKLSIIERELLLKRRPKSSAVQYKGDWSTKGPEIIQFADIHHIHRNHLKDSVHIFNRPSDQGLLIIIDHIEPFKASAVFGCSGISHDVMGGKQVTCHARHDLMALASPLPTSRYEPRRTVLKLSENILPKSIDHVGFDFTNQMQRGAPPETISILKMSRWAVSQLRTPSLLESLIRRVLFFPIRMQVSSNLNSTTELLEIELVGLESTNHPALSVALVTGNCASRGRPHSSTILYYRRGYMSASAHLPPIETKVLKATRVKLSLRESILRQLGADLDYDEKSYLDIYLDGTCENLLELELDLLDLAAHMLQTDLGTILSSITFLVTASVVTLASKLTSPAKATRRHELVRMVVILIGSTIVVVASRLIGGSRRISITDWSNSFTSILLALIFSHGLVSFSIYFTRRLIDLATIINNTHLVLKHKVTSAPEDKHPKDSSNAEAKESGHGSNGRALETKSQTKTDLDWPLIGMAIASGAFLSSAPITVLAIFLLIKTSLRLSLISSSAGERVNKRCCEQKDTTKQDSMDHKDALIVYLIIMSSLVLMVNIPDLLLKLTTSVVNLPADFVSPAPADSSNHRDFGADYAAISLVLILKKLICDRLEKDSSSGAKLRWMKDGFVLRTLFRLTTSRFTSALTLVPIILIESNIRLVTTVELLLSMWLLNYLNFRLVK